MSAPCTRAEEAARILAYARERLSDLGGCTFVESRNRSQSVPALGGDLLVFYSLTVTVTDPDAPAP